MYVQNWSVRPNEKEHLSDVLKKLSFTWTRFNCNFYSWGRLFSAYFQRNILISWQILWHVWRPVKSLDTFCKRFEILAPSWIDTRLLIKLRGGIKRNRVWMKKNFGKKFRNGETKSHRRRNKLTAAGKGELVCWVCLICKVTLEVSWFDL